MCFVSLCCPLLPLPLVTLTGAHGALQNVGAVVSLVGYNVLVIPMSFLLALVAGMHLQGLWLGMVLSYTAMGAVYLLVVLRTNWQRCAVVAQALALGATTPLVVGTDAAQDNDVGREDDTGSDSAAVGA